MDERATNPIDAVSLGGLCIILIAFLWELAQWQIVDRIAANVRGLWL